MLSLCYFKQIHTCIVTFKCFLFFVCVVSCDNNSNTLVVPCLCCQPVSCLQWLSWDARANYQYLICVVSLIKQYLFIHCYMFVCFCVFMTNKTSVLFLLLIWFHRLLPLLILLLWGWVVPCRDIWMPGGQLLWNFLIVCFTARLIVIYQY